MNLDAFPRHPLTFGGLGFARRATEVERQEAELGVFFDTILVCSVTGSTQAGMIDLVAGRVIEPSSTVLYAHLGGQPALNAYRALFSTR